MRAVDGVFFGFVVNEGEVVGVVGESGCGKSTLARMLADILRPTSGEILFRGRPLAERAEGGINKASRARGFPCR